MIPSIITTVPTQGAPGGDGMKRHDGYNGHSLFKDVMSDYCWVIINMIWEDEKCVMLRSDDVNAHYVCVALNGVL